MSDLVKRLRQMDRGYPTVLSTAADRIEQLEQELRVYMDAAEGHMVERMRATDELAAEKALADRLYETAELWVPLGLASMRNFRKARGL